MNSAAHTWGAQFAQAFREANEDARQEVSWLCSQPVYDLGHSDPGRNAGKALVLLRARSGWVCPRQLTNSWREALRLKPEEVEPDLRLLRGRGLVQLAWWRLWSSQRYRATTLGRQHVRSL